MDYLAQIESVLGLDNDQDTVLTTIINLISQRLKAKTQQDNVPEALDFIVVDARISRFSGIFHQRKQTSSESEVSATYQTDDLAPFADDIADWVAKNVDTSTKGKFTFY